jgi:hypothetical protein
MYTQNMEIQPTIFPRLFMITSPYMENIPCYNADMRKNFPCIDNVSSVKVAEISRWKLPQRRAIMNVRTIQR